MSDHPREHKEFSLYDLKDIVIVIIRRDGLV